MIQTDLHKIACRFIGLHEVAGSVSNPAILAMLRLDNTWPADDATPWCSAFANYVAWLLDLPRSKSLAARSWLTVGAPVELAHAERGRDVVVFSRGNDPASGHVAIFDKVDAAGVWVVGGNQGDSVSLACYPVARVLAVRRLL